MITENRIWPRQASQDQEHQVLKVIAAEKVIPIELLLERFPWVRWGDLLSLLGAFRQEGLITVHQVGCVLEIRITKFGQQHHGEGTHRFQDFSRANAPKLSSN